MIIDTMTFEDIRKALMDELNWVKQKINYYLEDAKMRKKIAKKNSNEFPINFKPYSIMSKSKISYNVILECESKKFYKEYGVYFVPYTTFRRREGLYAACINTMDDNLLVYTPHFIQRYKERFLKDETITSEEAYNLYFKHNSIGSMDEMITAKYKNNHIQSTTDGITVFSKNDNIILAKTFLSRELLKGNQIEKDQELDEHTKKNMDLILRYN